MRIDLGETEDISRSKTKHSTAKLLNLILKHHGQDEIKATDDRQVMLLENIPVDSDYEDREPIEICVLPIRDPVPTIDGIKRVVCRHYGITHADILSSRRHRKIARPRQIAMYLCKELTGWSFPYIGQKFGGKDHTTVLHAARKVQFLIASNPEIRNQVSELRAQL